MVKRSSASALCVSWIGTPIPRFTQDYRDTFANPYKAASLGYLDEIIRPRDTRWTIVRALRVLANKRQSNLPRKHGNIPL